MKFAIAQVRNALCQPIPGYSLASFRILFGILMLVEMLRYFVTDKIRAFYIEPKFHFTYLFAPFVAPLPAPWMYAVFTLMAAAALSISIGLCFRTGSFLFFFLYTYVFLIDKAAHNNHYYLICVLSLLLSISSAGRCWSLDNLMRSSLNWKIPRWNLSILRFQIALVFFYAGVAKLNFDWLNGEPMRAWLCERAHYPMLGSFMKTDFGAMFFSYGGLFFDLLAPFFLVSETMLWLVVPVYIFFNLMNGWLFTIGIFPCLVLASLVLFVPPEAPRKWWHFLRSRWYLTQTAQIVDSPSDEEPSTGSSLHLNLILLALGIYVIIQILVPLRHFIYPGDVSWTEEGHNFSWHMKLRGKEGWSAFFVTDSKTGQRVPLDPYADISARQHQRMTRDPDMIWTYARYLARKAKSQGAIDPVVRVKARVALNGRPPEDLIEPEVDLSKAKKNILTHSNWISKLENPTPHTQPELVPVMGSLAAVLAVLCALLRFSASQKADLPAGIRRLEKAIVIVMLPTALSGATLIFSGMDWAVCYVAIEMLNVLLCVFMFLKYLVCASNTPDKRRAFFRFLSVYAVTIISTVSLVLAWGGNH